MSKYTMVAILTVVALSGVSAISMAGTKAANHKAERKACLAENPHMTKANLAKCIKEKTEKSEKAPN